MISVNPIFFPPNSISDISSENSTKLFKNPKYLFADLIKVNESIIDEENGFPESFFKLTQNISEQAPQEIIKQDYDNSNDVEFYPLFSAMQNLTEDAVKPAGDNKIEFLQQSNGNSEIKIKDAGKETLKTFLTVLINSLEIKLKDVKILTAGDQSAQKSESPDFPETGTYKISDEQISKILEQLDNGSILSFGIKEEDALKVFAGLKKFFVQTTSDKPKVVTDVKNKNEIKTPLPDDETGINSVINYLSEKTDVKIEIKITGKDEIVVNNDKVRIVSSNKNGKTPTLKNPENTGAKDHKAVTRQTYIDDLNNTANDKKQFTVSLIFSEETADNKADETKGFQFITRDAFRTMLQHDDKLKQLRSKVSDIFKNVENINVKEEVTGNKTVQKNIEVAVDKKVVSEETGTIKNIPVVNEKGDKEALAVIQSEVKENPQGEETNPQKNLNTAEEKIKIQEPELSKPNTDGITKTRLQVSDNTEHAIEEKVIIETSEPGKTSSEKTVVDKKTMIDQEQLVDENKIKDDGSITKPGIKQKKIDDQLSLEKITVTTERKIEPRTSSSDKSNVEQIVEKEAQLFNHVKNIKKDQAQLDNVETTKILTAEVEKSSEIETVEVEKQPNENVKGIEPETNKPVVKIKEQNNPVKISEPELIPEDKTQANRTGLEKPVSEIKVEIENSEPGKIFNSPDEKVIDQESIKSNTKENVESQQAKSGNIKTADENKIITGKSEIEESKVNKAVENKQAGVEKNIETKNKIEVNNNETKQKIDNLDLTEKVYSDKPDLPQTERINNNKPEFTSQSSNHKVDSKQQNFENVKVAGINDIEPNKQVIDKPTTEKPEKQKHSKPDTIENTIKETVKISKQEPDKIVVQKSVDNSKSNIEEVKYNQKEVNKTVVSKENQADNQNNPELNEHSQDQKKDDYTVSAMKDKSETVSFETNKKVNTTTNDITGIKENFVDRALTNHVVFNKTGDVQPQQKIINNLEVFNRVSELIQTKDKKSIEIKLDPPDLGKMNIRIDHDQNKIYVNIEVKDESVRGMIYHNLEQLRQTINQNGLQLQEVFVSLNGEEQRQSKSFNKNKRNLSGKTISINENTDTELSSKKMGYNTYDYLI